MITKKKKFDAVALQRKVRDIITKDIQNMSFEEEIEYFRKAADSFWKDIEARKSKKALS